MKPGRFGLPSPGKLRLVVGMGWMPKILLGAACCAALAGAVRADGERARIHDPSTLVEDGGSIWCFGSGNGIPIFKHAADGAWVNAGRVFAKVPEWHAKKIPGNNGFLWAPDIIRSGNMYYLYYSVSTFGSKVSAIGMAASRRIDGGGEDRGEVMESGRADGFNAIDPSMLCDNDGRWWMTFGSYWTGIKLVELDPRTGMRKHPRDEPVALAAAKEIEASYLYRHGGYYYLFVNHGQCCRGIYSTYEIVVGRSRDVRGPYLDAAGGKMLDGGGTLVIGSEGRYVGPGHASVFRKGGREWLACHFYDKEMEGRPYLRVLPLRWSNKDWPEVVR